MAKLLTKIKDSLTFYSLAVCSPFYKSEEQGIDNGGFQVVIDRETGEVLKRITRAPNSDISRIVERDSDGNISSYRQYAKSKDGIYVVEREDL